MLHACHMPVKQHNTHRVWGAGRRAPATSAVAPRADTTPPTQHTTLLLLSFLSSLPKQLHFIYHPINHSPWSTNHLGPGPPNHTTITPTNRIPVLDHPNSKLWAGGQGRQAQRRRGTRITTNRLPRPQTPRGPGPGHDTSHDITSDTHHDGREPSSCIMENDRFRRPERNFDF
jgi:hypothetical protein